MSRLDTIPLHSLLERPQVTALLKEFEALMPGVELALIQANGQLFAGSGVWPEIDLAGILSQTSPAQIAEAAGFFLRPLVVETHLVGALISRGAGSDEILRALHRCLSLLLHQALEKRDVASETLERYREVNLLYNIGETINTCLDPDEIPLLVLMEANRVIRAKAGLVLLPAGEDPPALNTRASFGPANYTRALQQAAAQATHQVFQSGQPAIVAGLSAGANPIESILCAPLKTRERTLGVIILGRLETQAVFTAGDEKLLMTLANQAAVAFENAYLFVDVKRQRDAIVTMKNYMENIFASIASGVITTDSHDLVVTLNQAAERILQVKADQIKGQPYVKGLPGLGRELVPLVNTVRRQERQVMEYELESILPQRGPVVLRLHISPLKTSGQNGAGVAIVLEDLTERRQLEQQVRQVRRTFERYVTPRVVEQLLSDPTSVQLGGVGQEVTVLFADIRNFSAFSEKMKPEALIEILNKHLTIAAEAVLVEEGTLDKFMGDAVMALFNAPLPQPDHVLRAVRAALNMKRTIAAVHANLPPERRLSFGVGITSGPAVVGNIGSDSIQNYTAIGDSVNMAQRLQAQAQANQILLNEFAYQRIREYVVGRELGFMQFKGHSEPDRVYEVLELLV